MTRTSPLGLSFLLLTLVACGTPEAQPPDPREPVIQAIGTDVIAPSYALFFKQSMLMEQAAQTFCDQKTEPNLTALRQSWKSTRLLQQQASVWGIGDYEEVEATLGSEPSAKALDALAADSPEALTPERLIQEGANKRGLLAIEYTLFGAESADAISLSQCALIKAQSQDIVLQTQQMDTSWNHGERPELTAFTKAGEDTSRFDSRQMLLSLLVNHLLGRMEFLTYTELGKPSGLKDGVVPNPSLLQGHRSQSTKENWLATLTGLRHLMWGTRSPLSDPKQATGLLAPTVAQDPALAQKLDGAMADVEGRLRALDVPMSQALTERKTEVTELFEAMRLVVRLIKSEWAPSLGVSVTFNDNDGD